MPTLTFANTPLATLTIVNDRLVTAELLLSEEAGSQSANEMIGSCLVDAKNELRKHLIAWAKEIYDDRLKKFLDLRSSQLQHYHERLNFDFIPPYSDGTSNVWAVANGGFNPISEFNDSANPTTYYFSGSPANGTAGSLVGEATNGDVLVDVATRKFYINRGTAWNAATPSVTWDRFNHRDAIDRITNPEELIESHLCETLRRMCQKGAFRTRPNVKTPEIQGFFMNSQDYWRQEFINNLYGDMDQHSKKRIPGALEALDIDFSGDGDISDFEKSLAREEHWGIV